MTRSKTSAKSTPLGPAKRMTDRKRADILAAAVDLFSQTCFDQVCMDSIAQAAMVSKRTVYNHFDSKDALFAAIVEGLKESGRKAIAVAECDTLPLWERLEQFALQVANFHCRAESRRLARIILSRLLQTPSLGKTLFGGSKLFEQEFIKLLQTAVDKGELEPLDIALAAKQFLGLIEAFVVWPQAVANHPNPSVANRKKIANDCVTMFLATYSPKS